MSLQPPTSSNDPSNPPSPNTLATRLAEYDLPPPSALKDYSPSAPGGDADRIAERLSKIDLPPPEQVRKAEQVGRTRRNTDDVTEEIAKMDLPIPEGIRMGRHPSLNKKKYNKNPDTPHTSLNVKEDQVISLPEDETPASTS